MKQYLYKYLKKILGVYFIFSLLMMSIPIHSQSADDNLTFVEPQIMVTSRVEQNKIHLRWAANTSLSWRKLNSYGCELKRYTITRNNITLSQPEEKIIGFFKPKPLEEWESLIDTNDYAAIIAQSIYGEHFDVEGMNQMAAITNLAEEQEQRFTWALYAADQDFEIAKFCGWGYTDTDVKSNEKYFYKLISKVPENELVIKDGGVFTGISEYELLPKPLDIAAIFLDKTVILSWNYGIHHTLYTSYFIERSTDGSNFQALNDLPFSSLNNTVKNNDNRMFYTDSISNNKIYYYRIRGKTIFGELSPYSDIVSGKGEDILNYAPHITNKFYLDNENIQLDWEFPEQANEEISGFELSNCEEVDGDYHIVRNNIAPSSRSVLFKNEHPSSYFIITAVGKSGSKRNSFPVLVQPVDSIPPTKPIELTGVIDSLGIVTLKWKNNTEKDLLGYRIFRGNQQKEEFSQITISPHRGNIYYDSIPVSQLNDKVYYKIIAVDQRYNMSDFSEVITIKKPDFIAPATPLIKDYTVTNGKIILTWALSSSNDAVQYNLYCKKGQEIPALIETKKINPEKVDLFTLQTWEDEPEEKGTTYTYYITAIDDTGLISEPSPSVTVNISDISIAPAIKGFGGTADKNYRYITLFWKPYKLNNVKEIMIYKGLENGNISLWKNVTPDITTLYDDQIKPNNVYIYIIRVVFIDGSMSEGNKITVKY